VVIVPEPFEGYLVGVERVFLDIVEMGKGYVGGGLWWNALGFVVHVFVR
jgi:hypothetical protein